MRPSLDDQGRQARQVSEYRADETEGVVLTGRVVGDPGLEQFAAEQGSTSLLVSIVAPARVRSAYGDMTKAPESWTRVIQRSVHGKPLRLELLDVCRMRC